MGDNTIEEIKRWLTKAQKNFAQEVSIRESISNRLTENYSEREFIISRILSEVISLLVQHEIVEFDTTLLIEKCGIGGECFELLSNNNPFYDTNRIVCVYRKHFEFYEELWYRDIEGYDGAAKDLPFRSIKAITTGLIKYWNN
jgi:hypothetical protein